MIWCMHLRRRNKTSERYNVLKDWTLTDYHSGFIIWMTNKWNRWWCMHLRRRNKTNERYNVLKDWTLTDYHSGFIIWMTNKWNRWWCMHLRRRNKTSERYNVLKNRTPTAVLDLPHEWPTNGRDDLIYAPAKVKQDQQKIQCFKGPNTDCHTGFTIWVTTNGRDDLVHVPEKKTNERQYFISGLHQDCTKPIEKLIFKSTPRLYQDHRKDYFKFIPTLHQDHRKANVF